MQLLRMCSRSAPGVRLSNRWLVLTLVGVYGCGGLNSGEIRIVEEGQGGEAPTSSGGRSAGGRASTGGADGGTSAELGGSAGEGGSGPGNAGTGNTGTGNAGTGNAGTGGMGEGGSTSSDAILSVVSVTPAESAGDVEPEAAVQIRFSDAVDASSVSSESVRVLRGSEEVAGELDVDGNEVSFTPAARWSLLQEYEVVVTEALKSTRGAPLEEAFSSAFTVRDGVFSGVVPLNIASMRVDPTYVAAPVLDALGRGLVAWSESNSPTGQNSVYVRTFAPDLGFAEASPIAPCPGTCTRVSAASNAVGDVIVAWVEQSPAGLTLVRARRFAKGVWEAPLVVADRCAGTMNECHVEALTTGVSEAGEFHVLSVWEEKDAVAKHSSVHGYHAFAGKPFLDSEVAADVGTIHHLAFALEPDGNAMLAWCDGSVFTHRYSAGVATPYQGEDVIPTSSVCSDPNLASDGAGQLLAVWHSATGPRYARYSRASGWVAPQDVPHPTGSMTQYPPAVAWHGSGFAVSWAQDLSATTNAYVARSEGGKFSEAALLNDGVRRVSYYSPVSIGADAAGNVLATWVQQEGANDRLAIGVGRLAAKSQAWQEPLTVSGDPAKYLEARLTVAANGVALVTWAEGTADDIRALHAVSFQ